MDPDISNNRRPKTIYPIFKQIEEIDSILKNAQQVNLQEEVEAAVLDFTRCLQDATKLDTPSVPKSTPVVSYPVHKRVLFILKRRTGKTWQRNRSPALKTKLNRFMKVLTRKIRKHKNASFCSYLTQLDATKNKEYAQWKACRQIRGT